MSLIRRDLTEVSTPVKDAVKRLREELLKEFPGTPAVQVTIDSIQDVDSVRFTFDAVKPPEDEHPKPKLTLVQP